MLAKVVIFFHPANSTPPILAQAVSTDGYVVEKWMYA